MSQPNPKGLFPPPPAPPPRRERPTVDRPRSIDTAFQLTIAAIVVGVAGTVVSVLADPASVTRTARDVLANSGRAFTEADVAQLTGLVKVAGGFGVAIVAAAFVATAFAMRAGRSWARIVLVVFAAVVAFGFLAAVATTGATLDLMWNLAHAAFAVAAVVYLVRPESTKYFTESRRR